ncbi:thiamine phosphate synthase [Reichenbachiella carrageenanivorans]|uniref:Thiamine phosphate synthase n=1 Tax=Reichenbachiella carrageenanivorans TaxID=2979869 RepID=A0ABY6CWV5_9BACT|nr:thiamine phosphate synthase [Reichenbachiella carrageenanivorans]UXX78404.1 thiamine phosphate synthase [Reichenbachiella carrageenanivorans]
MKTIVITPETQVKGEIETCNRLLKSNIERLHIRKPFASEESMTDYLKALDQNHWDKISLHSHHHLVDELGLGGKHFKSNQEVLATGLVSKSFHSFAEIEAETAPLSYGFLSPIYKSISKVCYAGEFDYTILKSALSQYSGMMIYALGGIEISRMAEIQDLGFDGIALLGTIWSEEDTSIRIQKTEAFINA